MKNLLCILALLAITVVGIGQTDSFNNSPLVFAKETEIPPATRSSAAYPISVFSLSVNPLGFLQFGPTVNAEIGLTAGLVLNLHTRFSSLGLLSYAVHKEDNSSLDDLKGIAFGGGLIYFIGDNQGKPYVGFLIDYDKRVCTYNENSNDEWIETSKATVFIANGGYRFRYDSGFFINTGLFLGVTRSKWNWEDTYWEGSGDGVTFIPFGMAEVTLGIEF